MNLLEVTQNEIFSILNNINLVNVKFGNSNSWIAVAVLFSSEKTIDLLIDLKKSKYILEFGEDVLIKFQKNGYEFIIEGEINEIIINEPATATVLIKNVIKHINKRRFIRYEANLSGKAILNDINYFECKIVNISFGGAQFTSNQHINSGQEIGFEITLPNGKKISSALQIIRCSLENEEHYTFGGEFRNMDSRIEMDLRKYLIQLEKNSFNNIGNLKQDKNNQKVSDIQVAIFDLCTREGIEVRSALANIGIFRYTVFHDFKIYLDFIKEQEPKIVIVEADEYTEIIKECIKSVSANFPNIKVVAVLPHENYSYEKHEEMKLQNTEIVLKPFISNEFEDIIVKHL